MANALKGRWPNTPEAFGLFAAPGLLSRCSIPHSMCFGKRKRGRGAGAAGGGITNLPTGLRLLLIVHGWRLSLLTGFWLRAMRCTGMPLGAAMPRLCR